MGTFDHRYTDRSDDCGLDDVSAEVMEADALEARARLRVVAGFLRGLAATDASRWESLYRQDWAEAADGLVGIADAVGAVAEEALGAQQ